MNDQAHDPRRTPIPLYVDLDNTLIGTDILWEQLIRLVFHKPFLMPWMIFEGFKGKARLKEYLSDHIELPIEHLPWSKSVIEHLQSHKNKGGLVILATATHQKMASKISDYLGIFDAVLSTNANANLKGTLKARAIADLNTSLNEKHYAYLGDSLDDIPIWKNAAEAWIVSVDPSTVAQCMKAITRLKMLEPSKKNHFSSWIKLMRVQQWAKNILLFFPLILAHKLSNLELLITTFAAAVSFCFGASGVYLLNDCSDVFKDRAHPLKKHRPLASGAVPLWQGLSASLALTVLAFAVAILCVGKVFALLLLLYFFINFLYTYWIKSVAILDVVILSLFYSFRIFAGGVASSVEVSKWLLALSLFFFLSLAFGKRYQEIFLLESVGRKERSRGYLPSDQPVISICGLSAGFVSVMVLVLYISSPEVLKLYRMPDLLWLLAPMGIYWIARFWMLTTRGLLHDDPVLFALKDRVSWMIGAFALILITIAQFDWVG
jgi:4-hydroxybenzoate polyprenyltransferase